MTPQEQEEHADYCTSTGVLREMKLSEARAQKAATSWETVEVRHISRALFDDTDTRALIAPSPPGLGATARGVNRRASIDAGQSPARPPALAQDTEVAALRARVLKLETQIAQMLAKQKREEEVEAEAPSDAHFDWIKTHRDELRAYPDAYVLLDPEKGIVFHSPDGAEITARLDKLLPGEQDRLMVFHTSTAL